MKLAGLLTEIVEGLRRDTLDEQGAMRRLRAIVERPRTTQPWFYDRVDAGWEIRDERGLLATVPDPGHEREDDVLQIVSSARKADDHGILLRAIRRVAADVEKEIANRHEGIRDLVGSIERDVAQMAAVLKARGPNPVQSERVAAHVRDLVEVQTELDLRRRFLAALEAAMEGCE